MPFSTNNFKELKGTQSRESRWRKSLTVLILSWSIDGLMREMGVAPFTSAAQRQYQHLLQYTTTTNTTTTSTTTTTANATNTTTATTSV